MFHLSLPTDEAPEVITGWIQQRVLNFVVQSAQIWKRAHCAHAVGNAGLNRTNPGVREIALTRGPQPKRHTAAPCARKAPNMTANSPYLQESRLLYLAAPSQFKRSTFYLSKCCIQCETSCFLGHALLSWGLQ